VDITHTFFSIPKASLLAGSCRGIPGELGACEPGPPAAPSVMLISRASCAPSPPPPVSRDARQRNCSTGPPRYRQPNGHWHTQRSWSGLLLAVRSTLVGTDLSMHRHFSCEDHRTGHKHTESDICCRRSVSCRISRGEDDTFMSADHGEGTAITPPCVASASGRRYVAVARDAGRDNGWRRSATHWQILSSAPRQLTGRSPEAMGFEKHLAPQFDSGRACDLGQLRLCFT